MRPMKLPSVIVSIFALAPLAGCSIHHDPHYNPYAPPGGAKPVLRAADDAVQLAEDAVANLDARLENTLY